LNPLEPFMKKDLDAVTRELQDSAFADARQALGEDAYHRWLAPPSFGTLPDPDGEASLRGTCGDGMRIQLKIVDRLVVDSAFWTDGCGPSVICGAIAAELARGKTAEELLDFAGESILAVAGKLPDDHEHCAFLAARTLAAAANDYFVRQARRHGGDAGDGEEQGA
jgi:NifU homolog involved in Fe-S cluster formation